MLEVSNLSKVFPDKKLFTNVNLKFLPGNVYGIIGANGAGKSTFLKILSGEIEPTEGQIIKDKNARLSVLSQNQNEFDDFNVTEVVIMGNKELYDLNIEKIKYMKILMPQLKIMKKLVYLNKNMVKWADEMLKMMPNNFLLVWK